MPEGIQRRTRPRRNITITTVLGAVALLFAVVGAVAPAGADDPVVVDIRVELDFIDAVEPSEGPRVFEVTGVEAAAGTWELTEADEVENPSNWCGSVMVDVDPDAGLITVATEEDCNFHTAMIRINSEQIDDITLVSDDLWGPDPMDPGNPDTGTMDPVTITGNGSGFDLFWQIDESFDEASWLQPERTAVFAFTLVSDESEPTTTTTTEAESTTTTEPAPSPGGGATPIVASPTYTG